MLNTAKKLPVTAKLDLNVFLLYNKWGIIFFWGAKMIQIAIVEDKITCTNLLKEHIEKFFEEKGEDFQIECFTNGVQFIMNYRPVFDIVFMDIEMPGQDGMETAKQLRNMDENVCLIFVTNMAQFAIKGYEVSALGYIVKPVSYFELSTNLKKALVRIEKNEKSEIFVRINDEVKRIPIKHLKYIEVRDHSLIYNLLENSFEIRGALKNIEDKLVPLGFARCNSCYLVNLKHVSSIQKNTIAIGKNILQISRNKKKDFLTSLANYMGGCL